MLQTQDDKRMTVDFHLIDVFTEEEADAVTRDILSSIINRLAFEFNLSIGEPHLSGYSLPKDASGSFYSVQTSLLGMWNVAAPTIIPDATRRQELARLLERPLARADLHAAYRFAVSQSDAVARFMFLYNILLQLGGDNQGGVDNLVRQEEPNVRQRLRKRKPRVMETIYTRLRNEVGHVRAEATPRQTRTEIEHNVAALQAIVKVAISRVV